MGVRTVTGWCEPLWSIRLNCQLMTKFEMMHISVWLGVRRTPRVGPWYWSGHYWQFECVKASVDKKNFRKMKYMQHVAAALQIGKSASYSILIPLFGCPLPLDARGCRPVRLPPLHATGPRGTVKEKSWKPVFGRKNKNFVENRYFKPGGVDEFFIHYRKRLSKKSFGKSRCSAAAVLNVQSGFKHQQANSQISSI